MASVGTASGTGTATAVGRKILDTVVSFSGGSSVDFVGTTEFISLIESGTGLLSYGAELHLRSL